MNWDAVSHCLKLMSLLVPHALAKMLTKSASVSGGVAVVSSSQSRTNLVKLERVMVSKFVTFAAVV